MEREVEAPSSGPKWAYAGKGEKGLGGSGGNGFIVLSVLALRTVDKGHEYSIHSELNYALYTCTLPEGN